MERNRLLPCTDGEMGHGLCIATRAIKQIAPLRPQRTFVQTKQTIATP
jgi:hypothetical protein